MDKPRLVIPSPHPAAYDAFVTYTQDLDIGYVNPRDVELWVPDPGEQGGGSALIIENIADALTADSPRALAAVLLGIRERTGITRVLVKVHGVPWPAWASRLYEGLVAELDGRVASDLLGVDGYRWMSWQLHRSAA